MAYHSPCSFTPVCACSLSEIQMTSSQCPQTPSARFPVNFVGACGIGKFYLPFDIDYRRTMLLSLLDERIARSKGVGPYQALKPDFCSAHSRDLATFP